MNTLTNKPTAPSLPYVKKGQYICLAGYAGAGKDVLSRHLLDVGYIRHNSGDVIKRFFDPFTRREVGLKEILGNIHAVSGNDPYFEPEKVRHLIEYYESGRIISAFTEDREVKPFIRGVLEHGGELIYSYVLGEYYRELEELLRKGERVVNTRICLPNDKRDLAENEAKLAVRYGAYVIEVVRNNHPPASAWDMDNMNNLEMGGFIHRTVYNDAPSEAAWEDESYFAVRDLYLDRKLMPIFAPEYDVTVNPPRQRTHTNACRAERNPTQRVS